MSIYNAMLVAGNRYNGAKQFGSVAEENCYNLHMQELLDAYGTKVVKVFTSLGCLALDLTEEEANTLLQDHRIFDLAVTVMTQLPPKATPPVTEQQTAPWHLAALSSQDEIYSYTTTGENIPVYVFDTNVLANHAEFDSRVELLYDATAGAGLASVDHGTAVAALIGGSTVGVAKACLLKVILVQTEEGGYIEDMLDGIDYILQNHPAGTPGIVNISVGGVNTAICPTISMQINSATSALITDGIHCIVAAGNYSRDAVIDAFASINENIILVGASDAYSTAASFTNYGSRVDLFAPGVGVTTASGDNTTDFLTSNGTSMAAALVSGIIARYLELDPKISPSAMKAKLHSAGVDSITHLLPETTTKLVQSSIAQLPITVEVAPRGRVFSTPLQVELTCNKPDELLYYSYNNVDFTLYETAIAITDTTSLYIKTTTTAVFEERYMYVNAVKVYSDYTAQCEVGFSVNRIDCNGLYPPEKIASMEGTNFALVSFPSGRLSINGKINSNPIVNFSANIGGLQLTADDSVVGIPTDTLRLELIDGSAVINFTITGFETPAFLTTRFITVDKLGYAELSVDNLTFSSVIKITALPITVWLKVSNFKSPAITTYYDLALVVLNLHKLETICP